MMYETEQDRQAELEIIHALMPHLGMLSARKLPAGMILDFLMTDADDGPAYAEVKDRPTLGFGSGDGYYLSRNKVLKAADLAAHTGSGAHLAVRFKDRTIWHAPLFRFHPGKVIMFGRRDRGDPRDITPCVVYPWPAFKQVAA